MSRPIELPGIWNLRDLAGLGGLGRGVLLRSDSPHRLSSSSWAVLAQRGVTTVIDLRTSEEARAQPAEGPLSRVPVPLEDGLQQSPELAPYFEDGRIGTPLYYAPFTRLWPERVSEALDAIAAAGPGVLVHCRKGCDRTGMIVALVLEALETPREEIIADYLMTASMLSGRVARELEIPDENDAIDAIIAREGTTLAEALSDYLDGVGAFLAPHCQPLRAALHAGPRSLV